MPQVARLGDVRDHGGVIITARDDVFENGIGVARDGDLHSCPIPGHGITPLSSDSNVFANGRPKVRIGDSAACGAVIIRGSPDVTAN